MGLILCNSLSSSMFLTLSWRRPLSYRNQSIDLQSKSMDWFLYDNGPRHESVNNVSLELQPICPLNVNITLIYFIDLWQFTKRNYETSWAKTINTRSYYVCCASSSEQNSRNSEVCKTEDCNGRQELQMHRYFDTESMILLSFLTFWYLHSPCLPTQS